MLIVEIVRPVFCIQVESLRIPRRGFAKLYKFHHDCRSVECEESQTQSDQSEPITNTIRPIRAHYKHNLTNQSPLQTQSDQSEPITNTIRPIRAHYKHNTTDRSPLGKLTILTCFYTQLVTCCRQGNNI